MPPSINIALPSSWQDLTDAQLLQVFTLFSLDRSTAEVKTICLLRWANMQVVSAYSDSSFLVRKDKRKVVLSSRQIQAATAALNFLDDIPTPPVRLSRIGRHKALDANFEGVEFEKFIFLDNLFQGVLHTADFQILTQMTQILYGSDKISPTRAQLTGTFYWFAGLKQYLAALYPHFFVPADNSDTNLMGGSIFQQLRDACNAQIRALTGGDVTKEKAVLALDTHRALTELDALARDADDYKKQTAAWKH